MNNTLVNYNNVKFAKFNAYRKRFRTLKHAYNGEFTNVRIDPTTVPEGKFLYHTRHADDDLFFRRPVTIELPHVVVNFAGSFITDKEIEFPNKDDKYIEITRVKINYS